MDMGFSLFKSSLGKLFHPEELSFSLISVGILGLTVAVKLWMGWFNGALGKRIQSNALAATAADSRSDALATAVVLLGLVITHFTKLQLDGWLVCW